jgi:hypothetical protein
LILFMSDGEPSLPFGHQVAEAAAIDAAKLASESGIRVNTFALGSNPVTREVNHSIVKMAARSNGRFVAVDNPGEIVATYDDTDFAFVDRIRLINRTTGRESDSIATGIGGSFYGEIGLVEGVNEIEAVAYLLGGSESSKTFYVEYQNGTPTQELLDQLERVRRENASLTEQIRQGLAREIESNRVDHSIPGREPPEPQDNRLDVRIERIPQEKVLHLEVEETEVED